MSVHLIKDSLDIPATLRRIADRIEEGDLPNTTATLILDSEVFHLGVCISDDAAACQTVFDCNYAVSLLMSGAIRK